MQTTDTAQRYGWVSILNHWLLAVFAIAMLTVGTIVDQLPRESALRLELLPLHKATGVIVLILATWHLVWRLRQGFPGLAGDTPGWEALAARAAHWFFLIGLIVQPLAGLLWSLFAARSVSVFGVVTIPALGENAAIADAFHLTHEVLGKALIAVLVLHVLAALKRHFINRDTTLKRMLGIAG